MADTDNSVETNEASSTEGIMNNSEVDTTTTESNDTSSIDKMVTAKLEEVLKPMKENLDSAYNARDEALKKVAEFEAERKAAEIKRLQEEGEHKKAFELQLAEERSRREALEKRNVELTRDVELRSALSSTEFRNKNAAEMAYKEIVSDLVQNENGQWVHKTGVSIADYAAAFVADETNSFLLKQKISTGAGSTSTTTSPAIDNSKKSLFSLPQAEVLKMAQEGKLPGR